MPRNTFYRIIAPYWFVSLLLVGLAAQGMMIARHVSAWMARDFAVVVELNLGESDKTAERLEQIIRESNWGRQVWEVRQIGKGEALSWLGLQEPDLKAETHEAWVDMPPMLEVIFRDPAGHAANLSGFVNLLQGERGVGRVVYDQEGLQNIRQFRERTSSSLFKTLLILGAVGLLLNLTALGLLPVNRDPMRPVLPQQRQLGDPVLLGMFFLLMAVLVWPVVGGICTLAWPRGVPSPPTFGWFTLLALVTFTLCNAGAMALLMPLWHRWHDG